MRLLVLADVHSSFELLSKIMKKEAGNFDAIIAPGDFTDMYDIPEGFTQLEMAEITVCRMIAPKKPVFAVPGNHDPYNIMEIFREYGINAHCEIRQFKGFEIMGWGGAMTPFDTKFEPTEEETEKSLYETSVNLKTKDFILIIHNPPYETALDMISDKTHVGSKAVRKFIEEQSPLLSISAHIHESEGIDTIGRAVLFYPGAVFEGKYGFVEIKEGNKVKCEMKKL